MPKTRARRPSRRPAHRIRFLCSQQLADGTTKYHWKPSPRLRRMGWTNHDLGKDLAAATAAAIELNEQLDASLAQPSATGGAARPRYASVGEVILAYRASEDFRDLKPGSQKLYGQYLARIQTWAEDGRTAIVHITPDMVQDYRDAILAGPRLNSAINHLKVLRLFFNWARRKRFISTDPATDLDIPATPSRTRILDMAAVDALKASALALKWPGIALAIDLGLWTVQRQGDLLRLPETAFRAIDNIDPADAAMLAGQDGIVRGFRLRQTKTGVWIDAPLPPALHGPVQASLKDSSWVIPMDEETSAPSARDTATAKRHYAQTTFQKRWRKVRDHALAMATKAHADYAATLAPDFGREESDELKRRALLIEQLTNIKFHDLRRTGMCMYGDLGVPVHLITALSGHAVLGKKTILDTYMPGNTRAACACVALALRNLAERQHPRRATNQKD